MLGFLAVLLALSSSGGAPAVSDPCVHPSWPDDAVVTRAPTFFKLQEIYLREVPDALMSERVVAVAESAASDQKQVSLLELAQVVSRAVYQTQLQELESRCGARLPDAGGAPGIIERAYARVLAHTDLRQEQETAERLLPDEFSTNLTPRVAVVGLSIGCSASTPALAALLARASVPCGPLPEALDGR